LERGDEHEDEQETGERRGTAETTLFHAAEDTTPLGL
jgi:hypothetical protein